jgi:hypothetical protein
MVVLVLFNLSRLPPSQKHMYASVSERKAPMHVNSRPCATEKPASFPPRNHNNNTPCEPTHAGTPRVSSQPAGV